MQPDAATLRDLYGTEQPPEPWRMLRAGPLAARLEGGNLRYLSFEGVEILRGIAYVVRDRDWGTYAPEIRELAVRELPAGFSVGYRAACRGPAAVLHYRIAIDGHADGRLRFAAEVEAEGDFETNRCGFVVLHAADAAGTPAVVEHCDGCRVETAFPELIDPWRPFLSVREISHRAGGRLAVTCRLEGEAFETEDQRNWSDASFKTYGRPLELPRPFVMRSGERSAPSVTVTVGSVAGAAAGRRDDAGEPAVEIGGPTGARFPEVGLVVAPEEVAEAIRRRDRLAEVGPQRILCAYDPTAGHGAEALQGFAALQAAYPAAYDLECVVIGDGDLDRELGAVALAADRAGLRLASVAVCPAVDRKSTPPGSAWPACPPLEEIYAAARRAFPRLVLGGGMFSYFTELNRKRPPVALLDFVTHATNPIVHAADDDSVMETLEALPHITRSTRAIIGARAYRIGPSTIAMRQNPYGSRTLDNPAGGRLAMAHDDPRQRGRFAAAWTAGYGAAIAPADVAAWVPAAFTGPRGLVDAATGRLLPVGRTVAALTGLAGGEVLAVAPPSRRLAVLAVRTGAGGRAILANLCPEPCPVAFQGRRELAPFEVAALEVP